MRHQWLNVILVLCLSACSSTNGSHASWMGDHAKQLRDKRINQLTLPGTHFANAYDLTSHMPICQGEISAMTNNAKLAQLLLGQSATKQQEFMAYLNTQDQPIYNQLKHGMRYLELQICWQNATYYTANYYLTATLAASLQQIRTFLNDNSQELLIIDLDDNLRSPTGLMTREEIALLHDYLQQQLGHYLIPEAEEQPLTLAQLWQSPQRIILLSSNPWLGEYDDVWNKATTVLSTGHAHYTTIKKLTAIQAAIEVATTTADNKLNIIPIYSWYDAELNNSTQIKSNSNDHLILDYLYSLPATTPLNIIVTDHQYAQPLVDFAIQKNISN